MATVFLARTLQRGETPRFVALKAIHEHLAERADFVEMFVDEARISSRIHHPNVCAVYDLETVEGTYFLAMEYLMGETLSSIFRRTSRRMPADPERFAALITRTVADACAGLHAAHELRAADGALLDVVHRDMSPENVFVTYGGVTKVMDFGLASAAHQTHRTRTGIIKGKFGYVAPELLSGFKADRRADVFSLGVVMWELLTGRRLFQRESEAETLCAVSGAPIVAPSSIRQTQWSQQLDAPVLRALERDRSRRYPSAQAFAEDLLGACNPAASIRESEVAEWMAELFPDERRRKTQLLELVERLGSPAFGTSDSEFDGLARAKSQPPSSLHTTSLTAMVRRYASDTMTSWRGRPLMPVAVSTSLLLAGTALTRSAAESHRHPVTPASIIATSLPTAAVAEPRVSPPLAATATATATATAVTPAAAATSEAPPQYAAVELPEAKAYVLEIAGAANHGSILLRVRPAPHSANEHAVRTMYVPPAATSPSPVATASAPPCWLRRAMRVEQTGSVRPSNADDDCR